MHALWERCHELLGKLSWLLVSEFMARLSRLVTLFVLAAAFSSSEYGLAMLALVCHELLRVLTRLGIAARIIQSPDAHVHTRTRSAATLQWLLAIALSVFQLAIADVVADYYQQAMLADLLRIMAASHVIYPLVAMRVFHLQRNGAMRFFGLAQGICITFENLFVAALVMFGADVYAVAWTKVAAALVWVMVFLRAPNPAPGLDWNWHEIKALCTFGSKTLGSESIKSFRLQADSLIAARLLSPELFGVYSFAKSAGLGIAQSLMQAYLTALYPFLCQRQRAKSLASALHSAWTISLLFAVGVIGMALLAPYYVEWLFGDRWHHAITTCQVLILAAIPALIFDQLMLTQRIKGHAGRELLGYAGSITLLLLLLTATDARATTDIAWLSLMACSISAAFALLLGTRHYLFPARKRALPATTA